MPVVLDASVALAWCFREEHGEYAVRVLRGLENDIAVVPGLWLLEVANGLVVGERRGRLSAADLVQVHDLLADLPIDVREVTRDVAFGAVVDLARTHGLSAYAAAYLQLAMSEGLSLATGDARLRLVAGLVGVGVVE